MANEKLRDDAYAAWEGGDARKAFRLFRALAEAGDKNAFHNLGYCYDVGFGTKKDRTKAFHWYLRAYRRGDSAAASNIATVYRDEGRHRLAFDWYRRAASMNDGDAEVEVAKLLMRGVGVGKHRGRAVAALKRAVASGSITEAGRQNAKGILKTLVAAK